MVVENCTVEDFGSEYKARYSCGPAENRTEVRVIERNHAGEVVWSYVMRPSGIMCISLCLHFIHIKYQTQLNPLILGPLLLDGPLLSKNTQ